MRRRIMRLLPKTWRKILHNCCLLSESYGQRQSIAFWKPVDREGNETPWYTYPAIEYLNSLDFSKSVVLEFGAGASSVWWSKNAKMLRTVEHDRQWFEYVSSISGGRFEIELAETEEEYIRSGSVGEFDVVIIDGVHRHRCVDVIVDVLKENGLVILDNSDWYPETARALRERYNLLQVDFHGFGPINAYTWTTSLFFSRSFVCQPSANRLPAYSVGALKKLAMGQGELSTEFLR